MAVRKNVSTEKIACDFDCEMKMLVNWPSTYHLSRDSAHVCWGVFDLI